MGVYYTISVFLLLYCIIFYRLNVLFFRTFWYDFVLGCIHYNNNIIIIIVFGSILVISLQNKEKKKRIRFSKADDLSRTASSRVEVIGPVFVLVSYGSVPNIHCCITTIAYYYVITFSNIFSPSLAR